MRAVLLVPRRADDGPRDRAWAWCRARWTALLPDVAIYEGHDNSAGPFSRAAALNEAARLADVDGRWDIGVVIDADIFIHPDQVRAAIASAVDTGRTTWAFQRWNGLTRSATELILASGGSSGPVVDAAAIEKTNPISWSCCFAVPRATWDDVGGFDERFRGWGWEDMAFQSVVCGLYGWERLDGDLYHLWHPRAEERIKAGTPLHPAYVANRMLGRRYMYALRVLGLHDRATPSDAADMEQDRQNLRRLATVEELDRLGQPRPGMPDWREWWPSLEELRDGARAGTRPGPPPNVALVVRSGGILESWPARRGYLEQALASIAERIHGGTIAARVIFSDWPEDVTPALVELGARHGFYVVGQGNRGFTPSMVALWRYLRSRKWPYEYVFLAEDDFVYERDVDLDQFAEVLEAQPHLVQVALLRDAFYQAERDAGGILGHPLEAFEAARQNGFGWLEHRRFFTLNPTLFRRSLLDRAWPGADHSEAVFGRALFAADPAARSALWGAGETWVRHLGEVRAGAGY